MALIGIITAIASMNQSLQRIFPPWAPILSAFIPGQANSYWRKKTGNKNKPESPKKKKSNNGKIITYEEAKLFKERYDFPALVSISINGPQNVVVNNESVKDKSQYIYDGSR